MNQVPIQNGVQCFRVRPYYLIMGIAWTIIASALGIGTTAAAYGNFGGEFPFPKTIALTFAIFWSCFAARGVYITWMYFRGRLDISESSLRVVTCCAATTVRLADVERVVWSKKPWEGNVVVSDAAAEMTITFENYSVAGRDALIAFCRQRFDPDVQEGWSDFVRQVLRPTAALLRISRINAAVFPLAMTLQGIALVGVGVVGLRVGFVALGFLHVVVAVWGWWRYGVRWLRASPQAPL